MKENYFLTLWNFTYLKDTSFGKKSCNFEHGLETKNGFETRPLITFFQCTCSINQIMLLIAVKFALSRIRKDRLFDVNCYFIAICIVLNGKESPALLESKPQNM